MLEAFINGKLSSQQENIEDLLTSCVFGSFKLLPPSEGLLPFLALAEHWCGGTNRLAQLASLEAVSPQDVDYSFWQMLRLPNRHPCEPDVLLNVKPTKQRILIEAKLRSGKSSEADDGEWPYDQLARAWDNLLSVSGESEPILVYLTADECMPIQSIEASVTEFRSKRPDRRSPEIYWLSWRCLAQLARDKTSITDNLVRIIDRLGLLPFHGFKSVIAVPKYSFKSSSENFRWEPIAHPVQIGWEFELTAG